MGESKHTQGKLEVSTELPYIVAVTAPEYCLREGMIISRGTKTGGQDWPAILPEERIANAERLALCWNAHDKLEAKIDKLLEACKAALVVGEIKFESCVLSKQVKHQLETAIAEAEKGD